MLPTGRISKKSMAVNSLNHSFNDSLESKENGGEVYPSRTASVAPEDFNGKTDFQAFSTPEEEPASSLYLGMLSYSDFCLLQDKENGKNRAMGVEKLQAAIESAASTTLLESNLASLVEDACTAVSDSHIKVSLAGLQLLEPLIKRTGSSLTPYLPSLVEAVLGKMTTNKHVLKKAGMKMLVQLMHYSRPHDVTKEVANFGLTHKHSKVREESLNIITAALIRFPKSEFRLTQLAEKIMPTLSDARPRVRQACMECAAKIASLCDQTDFRQVVSFAAQNSRHSDEKHSMAILEALQCRIVRECPPRLRDDGFVEYGMPVIGVDVPLSEHGPDVDWIRHGESSRSGNMPNGLEGSTARKESTRRPFRSAKKLPWELEEAEMSKSMRRDNSTNTQMNGTADLSPSSTLAASFAHQRPPSSKLFAKEGSNSPPTHRPPTGRKRQGLFDTGEDANGTGTRTPNGNESPPFIRDLQDMVPMQGGPPIPRPGVNFGRRHKSVPDGVVNKDLPTRSGLRKNSKNGSPQLSPVGSANSMTKALREEVPSPLASLPPPPLVGDLSVSWPRSRGGVRGVGSGPRKPLEQITADPLMAAGGVHDAVHTSVLRPPSKPRVRNPITMKQLKEEKKLKISLLQQHQQQQLQNSPQDNPEKEFLMCNNTTLTGAEDEYYSMVPEDNTALDNSLSSSLTSLCPPTRDVRATKMAEIDSLKHMLEKTGPRKAQLLSNECHTSNSPEIHHSPHDEIPVGPGRGLQQDVLIAGASHKKPKSNVGAEKDFSKTFTAGESLAHLHPSVTTWQAMQCLTQTAPAAAPVSTGDDKLPKKKKKKKKQKSGSEEGEGSSDGSDPTVRGHTENWRSPDRVRERSEPPPSREHNNHQRQKLKKLDGGSLPAVKVGFRRAASLGPEGQRPSIERGGTNTITMEVNGVKSPPPLPRQRLSPVARQTMEAHESTWKQRKSEPACAFREARETPGLSKPPMPPPSTATFMGDDIESSGAAVVRPARKKHSKYAVSGAKDKSPPSHRRKSVDVLGEGGVMENRSPGGSKLNLPELQPFLNVERGLRDTLDQLESSDWNENCEGLMGVRRLAVFHVDRLIPELHTVTLAVLKQVKNLRSSVARVAIACLGDVFVYTGSYMDSDVDKAVRVLLQKTGESNVFIREDVEKTLCVIVQYATPNKLMQAIIAGVQSHRNDQVRRTAAQFLGQAVEHCGPSQLLRHASRDLLEKILITTLNFISDAAAEPRYYGRKCLSHFVTAVEFEKTAMRTLNNQQWVKLRDAVETLRVKGVGDPPSEAVSRHPTGGMVRAASHVRGTGGGRTRVEEVDAKPRNAQRASQAMHSGENPPLPDRLVEQLKANNWEDRQKAINVLERFVDQHPKALEPHMNKVFDAFNPRLTDRNSKVNLQALQAFSNMVPLLGNLLAPISANVIKALMPNLASKNNTIHSAAVTVFDLISQCVDPMCLIQPIATHSQHGNARVQPIMIRKLAELTELICSQHSKIVMRQVLPVMWNLLGGKPPGSNDVKEAIVTLCESLFNSMGHSFVDSATTLQPQTQRRLNQILRSRNFN